MLKFMLTKTIFVCFPQNTSICALFDFNEKPSHSCSHTLGGSEPYVCHTKKIYRTLLPFDPNSGRVPWVKTRWSINCLLLAGVEVWKLVRKHWHIVSLCLGKATPRWLFVLRNLRCDVLNSSCRP